MWLLLGHFRILSLWRLGHSRLLFLVPNHHLVAIQLIVDAPHLHELSVSAHLYSTTTTDHNNTVGTVDGGEAVGNDNGCATFPGLVQSLLDYLLTLGVQGRGGFVKEEDLGVTDQSPSNGNSLLLPSTQLGALGSNIGIVALRMQ